MTSFFTKPWFVFAVVIGCFAILTPRILLPMCKQLLGLTQSPMEDFENRILADRGHPIPPHRSMPPQSEYPSRRPSPNFSPQQQQSQSQSSTGKSFMSVMLPMYAVGIGVYMIYTLCKVFSKKNETNELSEEILRKNTNRIVWNANNKEFAPLSMLNDDDLNGVNLDADYVEFLRKKRSGRGDTNDINTTLNMVKTSLNNINTQLIQADKKGANFPDDDLEALKLQLANTELKMAQILQQIEKLSSNDNQSHIDEAEDLSKSSGKMKNLKKKKVKTRKSKRKSSTSSTSSNSESISEEDSESNDVEELGSLESEEDDEKPTKESYVKVDKCSADLRRRKPERKESSSTATTSESISSEEEAADDVENQVCHDNTDNCNKKDC